MVIIYALIGFAILLIGRQLFWVVVSGLGFLLGFSYATQHYQGSPYMIILISLGVGAVGALLAYGLQRAAALLVGFLTGWFLTITLIQYLSLNIENTTIPAAIGGILGIILVSVLFDWSLIILSSLTGTILITQTLPFDAPVKIGVFVVLLTLGIGIQGILLAQEYQDYSR